MDIPLTFILAQRMLAIAEHSQGKSLPEKPG
jgi:hypothetical protein